MFWKDATVEAVPADLAVVHGPVEQCHPVLRTGFGEHVAHMIVHRSFADGETVSDLLIGQSFGHELDDLDLPGREGDFQRIGTVEGGHGRPPLGSC